MIEALRDQVLIIDPEATRRTAYRVGFGDKLGGHLNLNGNREAGLRDIEEMAGVLGLVVADIGKERESSGIEVEDLVRAALEARVPHVVVTTKAGKEKDFGATEGVVVLARTEMLRNLPQYLV